MPAYNFSALLQFCAKSVTLPYTKLIANKCDQQTRIDRQIWPGRSTSLNGKVCAAIFNPIPQLDPSLAINSLGGP